MRVNTAIDYFGSRMAIARVLGVSKAGVYRWTDIIPAVHAIRLEWLTNGALELQPLDYVEMTVGKSTPDAGEPFIPSLEKIG